MSQYGVVPLKLGPNPEFSAGEAPWRDESHASTLSEKYSAYPGRFWLTSAIICAMSCPRSAGSSVAARVVHRRSYSGLVHPERLVPDHPFAGVGIWLAR